jgi:hypothetical protein
MWLKEYLEKHIFTMIEKEPEIRLIEINRKKKYCKRFRIDNKNICRFYIGKGIENCYNRCALKRIKRQPKPPKSVKVKP